MKDELNYKSKTIYYDGNCPMCNIFADTIRKHDKEQTLINVNQEGFFEEKIKSELLLREIHLIDGKTIRTGPDAILTALAHLYPILKPIVFLIRLPIINWFARQIYFFISQRRLLFFGGDASRLFWLFLVTNFGLLAGILISWPAWQKERTYPLSPIIYGLDWLNQFTFIFLSILLLSLCLSFWHKRNFHLFSLISLSSLLPLIFLDITRLQPWIFHYGAILFLLTFTKLTSSLRTAQILDAGRLVVVSIYFWSGIQKMNTAFITEIFPWVSKPIWSPFGDIGISITLLVGTLIPFIEAGFALGLLTKRFRKISIFGSGLMLIFVFISLILGHHWNIVVWPWNLVIFSMVFILFYRVNDTLLEIIHRNKKNLFFIFALIFFFIMPLGNFFGKIDHYLSWSLYSGHVPTAYITAKHNTINDLMPQKDQVYDPSNTLEQVSFVKWSTKTMNLVPYPEERIFFNIFLDFCQNYPNDKPILTLDTRTRFLSHQAKITHYTCEEASSTKIENGP